MRDISCELLATTLIENDIGVQAKEIIKKTIPIIKAEDIYASEYYKANQQGHKPNLRLRISSLNYNNEKELIYMGITYSIIRVSEPYADEIVLICERKIKDAKNNRC